MHIKFSVVINTFERETQILDLKNCFKSIFSQTHEPDEIILIHSGDEKFEKIHLGILSDKIRVINCPKKTNISEARNIGAKNCKNNYSCNTHFASKEFFFDVLRCYVTHFDYSVFVLILGSKYP